MALCQQGWQSRQRGPHTAAPCVLASPSAGFGAVDTGLLAGDWGAQQRVGRAGRGSLPWPPFPTRATTTGMGDMAYQIAAVALGAFGRDPFPSLVFGVIGMGISSGIQLTFAELCEGSRHMLSTPVNAQTLSLHLWKALKITVLVLAGIHTALGLQDISRSDTQPL